jgi:hypothetical protein
MNMATMTAVCSIVAVVLVKDVALVGVMQSPFLLSIQPTHETYSISIVIMGRVIIEHL